MQISVILQIPYPAVSSVPWPRLAVHVNLALLENFVKLRSITVLLPLVTTVVHVTMRSIPSPAPVILVLMELYVKMISTMSVPPLLV